MVQQLLGMLSAWPCNSSWAWRFRGRLAYSLGCSVKLACDVGILRCLKGWTCILAFVCVLFVGILAGCYRFRSFANTPHPFILKQIGQVTCAASILCILLDAETRFASFAAKKKTWRVGKGTKAKQAATKNVNKRGLVCRTCILATGVTNHWHVFLHVLQSQSGT